LLAGKSGRDYQQARSCNLADGSESGQSVVAHVLSRDRGDDLTGRHDAQRVAIGIRIRDGFIADDAAGAGLVFNHHRLAQLRLHRICEDAADDVGTTAGTE
jgi:hypothetical protein